MSERSPHSEPHLTWQSIENDDRLTFSSVEEMASFFDWRSGRLQEQLETYRVALETIEKGRLYWADQGLRSPGQIAHDALASNPASERHDG